ncbi:MAG: PspA/IM30 family protein [Spirochaetes bacterium]|nr:PspA/IM30 family protein [Deltaproteobacteria bacterium]RKY02713.1 MAG: PspA/IM30 family protein [Spirochaetota bacterium]RLA87927.1 MAG: PspA/IM30 family protein [Deltaproteobacteria bacterium]
MAGIFQRLFKVGQAEAHSLIDKFEDPIKLMEQGIRDLKKDLQSTLTSLAEVKAIQIRLSKEAEDNKKRAADYERKAMLLLEKAKKGEIEMAEAERLATEALNLRDQAADKAKSLTEQAIAQQKMVEKLQANVDKLKSQLSQHENELITLKARAKTAAATKKINKRLSTIDSSGTLSMIEKMKQKIEEDEALAQAYGEIAAVDVSVDKEIDEAINKGAPSISADERLMELKKKMGLT